ncbi:MAG: dockerin type I domain-containing protein [Clostridia bacterium]|nr:dockerin type I domain-containing protein [Clostridia bacterium]
MKKLTRLVAIVITLAMVMPMSMMFVSAADEGYAFSRGTLTITDKSLLEIDYTQTAPAWDAVKDATTSIVLPEGVTKLGSYVFQDFTYVTSFTIPVTVVSVGSGLFYGNTSVSVTYAGTSAQWAGVTVSNVLNPWAADVKCTGVVQTPKLKAKDGGNFVITDGVLYMTTANSGLVIANSFESSTGTGTIGIYADSTATTAAATSNAATGQYICLIDDGEVCDSAVIVFKGDVNRDGQVNSLDYTASNGTLDIYQRRAADINGDGVVNAVDRAALDMYNGNWPQSVSPDMFLPTLTGSSDVIFGSQTYITVKLTPSNPSNGIKAFVFTVTYDPTKFLFNANETAIPVSSCLKEGNYKITPNAGSVTIEYYSETSTPLSSVVDLVKLPFTSTLTGNSTFGITNITGVDSLGRFINVIDDPSAHRIVSSVSGAAPSEPVLKSKTSSSVKLEYSGEYIYGISTDPYGSSVIWAESAGTVASRLSPTTYMVSADSSTGVILFSNLDEITTYYFYRKQKNVNIVSSPLAVYTDIGKPTIKSSDASTIVVDIGRYMNGGGTYYMTISLSATLTSADYRKITIEQNGKTAQNGYIVVPVGSDGRSVSVAYRLDYSSETVTFSGLTGGGTSASVMPGTRYYVHVMHEDGQNTYTAYSARAISPEITINAEQTGNTHIAVKYAEIFRYSISSTSSANNFVKASVSGSTVNEGNQSYTVTHEGQDVIFSGLLPNTEYTIFVYVDDNDTVASEIVTVKAITGESARATEIIGTTTSTITIAYDVKNLYSLDGVNWTGTIMQQTFGTVGSYTYTVKSDSKSSTGLSLTFSGLSPNRAYTVYAKVNGSSTMPSMVDTKTACEHKWGAQTDVVEATYTNAGSYKHKCELCGFEETVTVPKLTNCKHANKVRTPEYDTVPSCTRTGIMAYLCPECGDYVYETIPATGHSTETQTVTVREPTCTTAGSRNILCSVCHEIIHAEPIAALGHSAGTPIVVPSTCTQFGITTVSCTRCGAVISTEYATELAPHTVGDWIVLIEATDTTDGIRVKRCTVCNGELDRQTISRTLHINPNGTYTYLVGSYDSSVNISDAITKAYAFSYYSLKITYSDGVTIELDSAAIEALNGKQTTVTYNRITEFAQASGAIALAGFDLTNCCPIEISSGGVSLGSGHATVSVPYEMRDAGKTVKVYYVDAMGTKTEVPATYDAATGMATFTAEHFSTYVIVEGDGSIVVPTGTSSTGQIDPGQPLSTGMLIAIVTVVVVVLATGGALAYIMLSAKSKKKKKSRKTRFNF